MNTKLNMVLALIIAGAFPTLALYAWQMRGPEYDEDVAFETAVGFLKSSPTFKFDGIPNSVKVKGVEILRSPWMWEITVTFDCRHAGYGDRTGMMLAQVITHHVIRVVVQRGEVVRAVIDDRWDEIRQCEAVQSELQPPEFARDMAIHHVLEEHEELRGLQIPSSWETQDITPQGLVGSSTQQYRGDGWTVNVTYPIIPDPTYTVEIEYTGEISFRWKGTVDQSGYVEETDYSVIR